MTIKSDDIGMVYISGHYSTTLSQFEQVELASLQ